MYNVCVMAVRVYVSFDRNSLFLIVLMLLDVVAWNAVSVGDEGLGDYEC